PITALAAAPPKRSEVLGTWPSIAPPETQPAMTTQETTRLRAALTLVETHLRLHGRLLADSTVHATVREALQPAQPLRTPGNHIIALYVTQSGKVAAEVTEHVSSTGRLSYAYTGDWGAG